MMDLKKKKVHVISVTCLIELILTNDDSVSSCQGQADASHLKTCIDHSLSNYSTTINYSLTTMNFISVNDNLTKFFITDSI